MPLTRRAFGVGALAFAGAAVAGGAVEWPRLHDHVESLLHHVPEPDVSIPSLAPGPLVSDSFTSAARGGRRVGWEVSYQPGSSETARLPVALVLHGRGDDAADAFGSHALGRFQAAAVAQGVPGALPANSPALWQSSGETARGAFDDAADFARNDVFDQTARLRDIPIRLSIGTSDPFYPATRAFAAQLDPRPRTHFSVGGHELAFWLASSPGQLRFLGHELARREAVTS